MNTNIKNLPEGEYFTEAMYSDRCAYKVIERKTDKKIILSHVKVLADPDFTLDFHAGGFMGNAANQDAQTWLFDKIDSYQVVIRFSKAKNAWFDKCGSKFIPNIAIHKHDYNF